MTLTEQVAAQPLQQTHRVHAVLVTHDGARWLPRVVRALQSLTRQPDTLHVVDTDSHDSSPDLVLPLQPIILRADRSEGFGDAIALAVEHLPPITDGVIDWIWLLHDDFAPDPFCLEELLRSVDDAPSVAVAGPKLRGWHDPSHLLEVGVALAGNGARWTGLERRERDQGQHDGDRDVLAVSSAGMLVRRDVWTELEGFDPNIPLFRDDVDFGWRVNVSGYRVICATNAIGSHAEAAATERRTIDVQAALHRPHLLDRRHGAYVLLANCSPTRVPLVFLRLVFSSLLRAVGYLFAKLPGYALDEVAGLALLVSRPDLMRQARSARKARRLLPARAVRPFLAPFGSQTRRAFEGIRTLLLRGWNVLATPTTSYTVIYEGDDDFDVIEEPLARRILLRPGVSLLILLSFIAVVANRSRWGEISGGALLSPSLTAKEVYGIYLEPWHHVGLGSATPAPLWTVLVAFLSLLTLGNVSHFVTLIFYIAIPASAMMMYALLRPRVKQHWYAAVGAFLYAVSPPVLVSVTSGRLAGVIISLLLPLVFKVILTDSWSWRRTWVATLLLGVLTAFSPLYFVAALLLVLGRVVRSNFARDSIQRGLAILIGAFLLNSPWSFTALAHPTRWLAEPGVAWSGASPTWLLGLNPGGIGAPPAWVVSPLLAVALLLLVLATARHRDAALFALALLAFAQLLAAFSLRSHDSGDPVRIYVGSLLIFVIGLTVVTAVDAGEDVAARLANANVGLRHIVIAGVVVASLLLGTVSMFWFALTDSVVKTGRSEVLPAFVAELSRTQEQKRTLVIEASGVRTHFAVLRGKELNLVDADVSSEEPKAFTDTVSTLLAGADDQTVNQLNRFNIGFILMNNPIDQDVARTLDSIGGLTRLSVTDGRILWQVGGAHGLVRLVDSEGTITTLVQEGDDLRFSVPGPGVIQLSERASSGWRAISEGKMLIPVPASDQMQAFAIPQAGQVVITYDRPGHRAGLMLGAAAFLALLVLITPSGRRLSEQSDEELA